MPRYGEVNRQFAALTRGEVGYSTCLTVQEENLCSGFWQVIDVL